MFHVENNVPEINPHKSRDFQLLSKLYDLVFQSCRYSINSIEDVSDSIRCNSALLPLLSTKVGIFSDLALTDAPFRKVLSSFPYIIRYKGSLKGLRLVANLFQRLMNTKVVVSHTESNQILISFEETAPNLDLLFELLDYVRPTGLQVTYAVRADFPRSEVDIVSTDSVTISEKLPVYSEEKNAGVVLRDTTNVDEYSSNVGFTTIVNFEELNGGES